tara:strand:+ start:115 stop:1398 length:1284 start_codon:yes stop_codon:yes gene_type:complete
MRNWGVIALSLALAACSGSIVPPSADRNPATRPTGAYGYGNNSRPQPPARQPVPATPIQAQPSASAPLSATNAAASGIVAGPPIASLPIDEAGAQRALDAFRLSCPSLVRRTDASGLTSGADWQVVCDRANSVGQGGARAFFLNNFDTMQIGDGSAYATGYYEPEIAASRRRGGVYQTPIYARPADLIDVDLGQFSDSLAGKRVRGRVDGTSLVPYYDRTAIEEGALAGRGLELAWGADPVEVFFLQVQGSGRLRLPDGSVMRVGYASQNGRDYTGIGKLMLDRGLIGKGEASMQGIVAWLHAHPDQGRNIMRENKSYVFFRELTGPGPLGALGLPVTGNVSVAVDPNFVPMGAPVFLSMDRVDATGLWVAQDTGGAIKGANRFDTFWGAGNDARAIAGGMSAHGTAFLLLPKATASRLIARGAATP